MSKSISDNWYVNYQKLLGTGASGKVYFATRLPDRQLEAAVKVVARDSLHKDLLRTISNEIKALNVLNGHPNIVKLYGLYEDRGHFYIVMEFIRGGELFDRITSKVHYSEKDARDLCFVILSAIKYAHDRNVVHRDLKPENLLMEKEDNDSQIKIVDFGFAEEVRDNCSLAGTFGTPMYMAPEIWGNQYYGKPVDIWSIGVITYILLCGYPPFSDERRELLVRRIKAGSYAFHEQYWSAVSNEAKDFIRKLLVIDPAKRLTVDQALQDPWIASVQGLEQNNLRDSLTHLKEFNAKRRLRGAVDAIIMAGRLKRITSGLKPPITIPKPHEDNDEAVQLSLLLRQYSIGNFRDLEVTIAHLDAEIMSTQEIADSMVISPNLSAEQKEALEYEHKLILEKVHHLKRHREAARARLVDIITPTEGIAGATATDGVV